MWCECNINVYDCISTYMNVMYMNVMYTNITNDFAMLKICKWLGWSLMSWSGAPILILNEARNSPKECAEGIIQNKLVNEWMENRRSNTVQNQQPAHVVKPGTPSKYYLCAAGRLILFESSRPCQIISSAHGCPAPTATDGEKSHILVRYITLFLLL
jgi:hypothetical protein